jgi:acyl-CoA thioesterase
VAFHDPQPASEWLLADGFGPVAKGGLMGWDGRLWAPEGRLVASGQGQLLCRPLRQ